MIPRQNGVRVLRRREGGGDGGHINGVTRRTVPPTVPAPATAATYAVAHFFFFGFDCTLLNGNGNINDILMLSMGNLWTKGKFCYCLLCYTLMPNSHS